jgi:hypothetical protein
MFFVKLKSSYTLEPLRSYDSCFLPSVRDLCTIEKHLKFKVDFLSSAYAATRTRGIQELDDGPYVKIQCADFKATVTVMIPVSRAGHDELPRRELHHGLYASRCVSPGGEIEQADEPKLRRGTGQYCPGW